MRKLIWVSAAALAALELPLADFAAAQEPNPNVPVQSRPRPDYDPLGLRAGAFLIYPQIDVDVGYDSNVFADKDDAEDDFLSTVSPRLTAASQWSRHSLQVDAGGEAAFYKDHTENNYQDFDIGGEGQLDITRQDALTANLRFGRAHDDRDDPDDENALDPDEEDDDRGDITQYYDTTAGLAYRHDFNRVYSVLRTEFAREDYENEGDIKNNDRDFNRYLTGVRVGYRVSPRFDVFGDAAYRWVKYDTTPNDAGDDRNNDGYVVRVGTGIDITEILFGELSLGYTAVTYDDDDLESVNSPVGGGQLTWNITPLTSLIFRGVGVVQETQVTNDEGDEASGRLHTEASINVWHELLRNVLLNGYTQYIRDEFEGIDRTDNTFRFGGGFRYLLNRNFSLNATYTYSTRNSDDSDIEYDRNQIVFGLSAQL